MGAQGQLAGAMTTAMSHPVDGARARARARRERPRGPREAATRILLVLGVLGLAGYAAYIAAGAPKEERWFFDVIVYHLPIVAGAGICLLNVRGSRTRKLAWGAIALGLLSWLAADVYYTEVLADRKRIPYPSWADAGYLLTLPCLLVGIRLIARERFGGVSSSTWLDGGIAALACACVGAALLEPALTGLTDGRPTVVATNLAYPVGDLILLSYLAGAITIHGLRGVRTFAPLALGLILWTGADAVYLYLTATGAYAGGWIDLVWPAGAFAIGTAAAFTPIAGPRRERTSETSIAIPVIAALAAVSVLMIDHWGEVSTVAVILGGGTLVVVALRLLLSAGENRRLVRRLSHDAVIDPLTGLSNRRKLYAELDALQASGRTSHLALFDLDGFKAYNDAFGHTVGDALLRNIGHRLRAAAMGVGSAYRLGGDEFCVLIDRPLPDVGQAVESLRAALHEHGRHFDIGASCGVVELGGEAGTPNDAMRIADQRMYADKGERARVAREQEAQDLLLSVLREHEPCLEPHAEGVGGHARSVATALGCSLKEIETIVRAAQLHDIGKVAVPEAILCKPGPLSDEEWAVMRDHTLIGQRILATVPALREVGALVRASHERWDGAGYPDGLAGEDIPLGSRVIFVCDAFEAMTEERPYQQSKSVDEALAELRRSAGTQFDPRVVEAFLAEFAEQSEPDPVALAEPVRLTSSS